MSAAYESFLLPLFHLPAYPEKKSPHTGPLEEETTLKGCDWDEVAILVKRTYGLTFLTACPPGGRIVLPADHGHLRSPERFLIMESPDCCWFVLEHPSALPLFDQMGRPDQRPALARPSLFSEWMTGAVEGADSEVVAPVDDAESLTAFHRHLAGLVAMGRPSDWHLEPKKEGYASRLRIDGHLRPVEWLSKSKGEWLVNSVLSCAGLDNRQPGIAWEGRFSFPAEGGGELPARVSLVPSIHGYSLVLRFLYPHRPGEGHLDALGMPRNLQDTLLEAHQRRDGLWLVAGPTGAGKSTTLHALLRLSVEQEEKVLAVEDPVERVVPGVQHLQVGRPQGLTFAKAVRAFMRQAPDCLLVGEIRDPETAGMALQAARTGHRVLSSIHARSSSGVRRRFLDLGQPPDQVASLCAVLLHQRLVPRLCPHCRVWQDLPAPWREIPRGSFQPLPQRIPVSPGCPKCRAGYKGRIGVFHLDTFQSTESTRRGLLAAALTHLSNGQTALSALYPFLPDPIRREFPLCQK